MLCQEPSLGLSPLNYVVLLVLWLLPTFLRGRGSAQNCDHRCGRGQSCVGRGHALATDGPLPLSLGSWRLDEEARAQGESGYLQTWSRATLFIAAVGARVPARMYLRVFTEAQSPDSLESPRAYFSRRITSHTCMYPNREELPVIITAFSLSRGREKFPATGSGVSLWELASIPHTRQNQIPQHPPLRTHDTCLNPSWLGHPPSALVTQGDAYWGILPESTIITFTFCKSSRMLYAHKVVNTLYLRK